MVPLLRSTLAQLESFSVASRYGLSVERALKTYDMLICDDFWLAECQKSIRDLDESKLADLFRHLGISGQGGIQCHPQ